LERDVRTLVELEDDILVAGGKAGVEGGVGGASPCGYVAASAI